MFFFKPFPQRLIRGITKRRKLPLFQSILHCAPLFVGMRAIGEFTIQSAGMDFWKIAFQLFERDKKSDPIGDPLVDLEVEVDSKLNAKAQAMADNGMTTSQAAFALGPAADTAKDPAVSGAKKTSTVQNTLKK